MGILGWGYDKMAKTGRKTAKRAGKAGRDGLRARRSGVSKAGKPGLRKPKSAKTDPRKQKSSLRSETARLKRQLKAARMQQEASAEILRAVASASGDAAGPLQLIAETTARLFNASSVSIQLAEGSEFTQEYRVGAIAKRVGSAYPRSNIKVGGRNLPGTVVFENSADSHTGPRSSRSLDVRLSRPAPCAGRRCPHRVRHAAPARGQGHRRSDRFP